MTGPSRRDLLVAACLWLIPSAALSDSFSNSLAIPSGLKFVKDAPTAGADGQWVDTRRWVTAGTMSFAQPGQSCTGEGLCQYLQAGDMLELTNNIQDVGGERYVQATIKNNGFSEGKLSDSRVWVKLSDVTADSGQIQWERRDTLAGGGDADGSRKAFVEAARQLEGTPYVWGGESRAGVDCSGLVKLSARMAGVNASLPRQSAEQAAYTGANLPQERAHMGDLAFFGEPVHHVAICADDGCKTIIEAPNTGSVVQEHELTRQATFGSFLDKAGG